MICAFSGHRPHRLPWGTDELDPRCGALKLRIEQELRREAVLALKREFSHLQLWAVLPCRSQTDRWPEPDRRRHEALCRASQRIILLQEEYSSDCMLRRNRWLAEHADCLLTVYDGGPGGTGWTVRAARRKGVPVIALWL